MKLIGATVLAVILFFVITFFQDYYLSGPLVTLFGAFLSALVQTAVFGFLFHYAHWYAARLFNWYKPEDRGEDDDSLAAARRPVATAADDPLADIKNI
jgi:hypothetical protein